MGRIAGSWELRINGRKMPVTGDLDCKGPTGKAEKKLGPNGESQGYSETYEAPYIKGTARITDEVDIDQDIVAIRGAAVEVTQPDGRVFIMSDADYAGDGNYTSGEGTVDFEFQGATGDWVQ